jgi:peptidyl-prolyl cis-trans isomerase C
MFRLTATALTAVALTFAVAHAQDADPDAPIAVVDGEAITVADLRDLFASVTAGAPNPPPLDAGTYEGLREYLVGRALIVKAAEADDLTDDPEVAAALSRQRDDLLAQFYMARQIGEAVDEEAIVAEYEREIAAMEPVEEVRASHILVPTQEQAQALREEIEGGADFADVAREHGTDGTKASGGDLGWFTRERMVAPFAEAAFAMEPGALSQPVQTQFGWHLIRLADRREQPKPSLEQLRPQITERLSRAAAEAAIESLRADAEIVLVESRPGLPAPDAPASE